MSLDAKIVIHVLGLKERHRNFWSTQISIYLSIYLTKEAPGDGGFWSFIFIFRELDSTGHFFMGAGEQAHTF